MVPLGQPLTITGRVTGREGRKVFTEGALRLAGGVVAVAGRGVYVEPSSSEVFDNLEIYQPGSE